MPRTYDEDGQPMMSNSKMLKMLVDEIPVNDTRMANLEDRLVRVERKVDSLASEVSEVKSDLKTLNIKSDQNHICLMTNQADMENRVRALEVA